MNRLYSLDRTNRCTGNRVDIFMSLDEFLRSLEKLSSLESLKLLEKLDKWEVVSYCWNGCWNGCWTWNNDRNHAKVEI